MSRQTQNKFQEIFDSIDFDFNNLYNIVNCKRKQKINIDIEEWKDKGLLTGYFGMLARNIYGRTRVKNSEILELLIYSAYIEEQSKLEETELNVFKDVASFYYGQGQEEVNQILSKKRQVSVIPDACFLALLDMPNAKGYTWKQYIEATMRYNADQICRQCVINIQQNKKNRMDDDVFQNIMKKQQNAKLCINGDKISGDVDLTLIGLNNQAKLQGIYSFDKNAKCKFITIEDEATTKECQSLNGQEFYIHDWNEFCRYSKINDSIVKYRCYGLVTGLNLPPINDGFHWCRSYIIYLSPLAKMKKVEYNNFEVPKTKIKKSFGDKKYTLQEIQEIAKEINRIVDKYTNNESKWSGNIVISREDRNAKLWSCDIEVSPNLRNDEVEHVLLHEQLHAHSISYYDQYIYKRYSKIEEATVELYTKEIGKRENIKNVASMYDGKVNVLKKINKKVGIAETDFDFAKVLFDKPVNKRLDFLEDKIYEVMQQGNIQDYMKLNDMLDKLRS